MQLSHNNSMMSQQILQQPPINRIVMTQLYQALRYIVCFTETNTECVQIQWYVANVW